MNNVVAADNFDMLLSTVKILILISMYYIGLRYPDVDLKIKGLKHRSIVTHSFFLPVALFILHYTGTLSLMWKVKYDITGVLVAGLCFGMTIHFLYDLCPKRFVGTALIQLPFEYRKYKSSLSAGQTVGWFILSCLIQALISVYYISSELELIVLLISVVATLAIKRNKEKGFYSVIAMFIVIFVAAFYIKANVLM